MTDGAAQLAKHMAVTCAASGALFAAAAAAAFAHRSRGGDDGFAGGRGGRQCVFLWFGAVGLFLASLAARLRHSHTQGPGGIEWGRVRL